MIKVSALIPAAGLSRRFSEKQNKLLVKVKGRSIIEHSVFAFDNVLSVSEIVIVTNEESADTVRKLFEGKLRAELKIVLGGKERQDSVLNGLLNVTEKYVLIHDAARPLVTKEIIENTVSELEKEKAVCVCVPCIDTIRQCRNGYAVNTPKRSELFSVQTPQGFLTETVLKLHKEAKKQNIMFTDDAGLCEWGGVPVKIIPGDYRNIKITNQNDVGAIKTYLGENMNRIGQGYDVHRLVPERKLILGGVEVPHTLGLLGHSDADVLIHAITDAILGAASLGDLGKHFPDTDSKFLNIDSMILLKKAVALAEEKGFCVSNIDATVIAQKPKLSPYIEKMRENISDGICIDTDRVNIKATTTEKMGFEGREEGISAMAVVMLSEI